ncbi:hypothetical protein PsorP6_012125 [Peronosclerospora sorghi]|uniref:Uncharacterized protein n=1 Tax=Peronosclerospora sorghi TaxID=230839 RepID=A0ACC0WMQ4_9STRA|nr:hypothetical protein PsorP6_012125 [Peronosclerospora sorghi]
MRPQRNLNCFKNDVASLCSVVLHNCDIIRKSKLHLASTIVFSQSSRLTTQLENFIQGHGSFQCAQSLVMIFLLLSRQQRVAIDLVKVPHVKGFILDRNGFPNSFIMFQGTNRLYQSLIGHEWNE